MSDFGADASSINEYAFSIASVFQKYNFRLKNNSVCVT